MEIKLLTITFRPSPGVVYTVHPAALLYQNKVILVDCGYPDSIPQISAELNRLGTNLSQIAKIIITHHDHDHMGALKPLVEKYPDIEVLCSEVEAPYILGLKKSLRLLQAEALQETLPPEEQEGGRVFQKFIASVEKVDAVTTIQPDEVISWGDDIVVVDTKGHMPGHISLYIPHHKTLITGDALVVENNSLQMPMARFVLDQEKAEQSIRNLLNYDIERILCYHGGYFEKDVMSELNRLVENFS